MQSYTRLHLCITFYINTSLHSNITRYLVSHYSYNNNELISHFIRSHGIALLSASVLPLPQLTIPSTHNYTQSMTCDSLFTVHNIYLILPITTISLPLFSPSPLINISDCRSWSNQERERKGPGRDGRVPEHAWWHCTRYIHGKSHLYYIRYSLLCSVRVGMQKGSGYGRLGRR